MKRVMRIISIFLLVVFVANSMVFVAFAIEPDEATTNGSVQSRGIISEQPILRDGGGNQYGYAAWSSLYAAQSYYGLSLDYEACSQWFLGVFYNFFYWFSDGTKMYFGVK